MGAGHVGVFLPGFTMARGIFGANSSFCMK